MHNYNVCETEKMICEQAKKAIRYGNDKSPDDYHCKAFGVAAMPCSWFEDCPFKTKRKMIEKQKPEIKNE